MEITSTKSKMSLVTHPIRARLLLTVMGRELTTQEMSELLPDIPKTSLYRHVRELAEVGVLRVVGEKAIRGTVEKRYAIQSGAVTYSKEDLLHADHDEYLRLVNSFLSGISNVYDSYLARREPTIAEDTLLRANAAYLSDEEFWEFRKKVTDLLSEARDNAMAPGRRRRIIGLLAVPDEAVVSEEDSEGQEK